ncbi:putative ABC transporter permease domain protein [Bacteroides fragilis str. 3719 T6]|nr:putative ABC transporter permease domain protein [Bacteroides fragilis str. 3986 N(B)19]EYA47995.1 putative ABC transporter permease domain protein [Bacteroides fragilis str. 3719 T6]
METYAYHTDIHGWLFVCVFLFTCIIVIISVMRQVVVAAKINPAESVKSE